jgi:hypothetical protein
MAAFERRFRPLRRPTHPDLRRSELRARPTPEKSPTDFLEGGEGVAELPRQFSRRFFRTPAAPERTVADAETVIGFASEAADEATGALRQVDLGEDFPPRRRLGIVARFAHVRGAWSGCDLSYPNGSLRGRVG